jgi:DNA helicase HerA-like ATPase
MRERLEGSFLTQFQGEKCHPHPAGLSGREDPLPYPQISRPPNRIDFRQIMREGKIFIANLEKGVLQKAAYVLGSFILSWMQLAALARRPGERKLFPILVDEFHNFASADMDTESIETFLSGARSYRALLVMATQYAGRLNRGVMGPLFGNVGTLICLQLGPIDAQSQTKGWGSSP